MNKPYEQQTTVGISSVGFTSLWITKWITKKVLDSGFDAESAKVDLQSVKFLSQESMHFFKSFLVNTELQNKFAWSELGAKLCGTIFGPVVHLLFSLCLPFLYVKSSNTFQQNIIPLLAPLIMPIVLPFILIANIVDLLGSLVNTLIEACKGDQYHSEPSCSLP